MKKNHLTSVPAPAMETPVFTPDAILAEAEMVLSLGSTVLDDHLAGRLESLAKDISLPISYRARALSLSCRFG